MDRASIELIRAQQLWRQFMDIQRLHPWERVDHAIPLTQPIQNAGEEGGTGLHELQIGVFLLERIVRRSAAGKAASFT